MTVKPVVKACLYAFAVMRYGTKAWAWGLWIHPSSGLVIEPGRPG
jgi:hypothetical protein